MKKFLLVILLIIIGPHLVYGSDYIEPMLLKAQVLEAMEPVEDNQFYVGMKVQYVRVKILSGKYRDQEFDIDNYMSDNVVYDIIVKKGDKITVGIEEDSYGIYDIYIVDFQRSNYVVYLVIAFVALILAIGRIKGLKAVISLALTIASIFYILIPEILKGRDPIFISILIAIGVTVLTIFLVSGFNYKSIAAILGTSFGVIIAGVIAYYIGTKAHLTGLSSEEASMLIYIPQNISFDFKNLLFAGIILGALGAVMDVGMSIASAIDEIYSVNRDLTTKDLFISGMNVGKDVMGTMTNTLILAYAGSSLPLLLLFSAYETSLIKVMNLDIIATEAVRSLAGSIGLVLTIPITAIVASILVKKTKLKEN